MAHVLVDLPATAKLSEVTVANQNITMVTMPGLPDWDLISPVVQLLAVVDEKGHAGNLLLIGAHQGVLPAYLAQALKLRRLVITDYNHTALEATRLTLKANNISVESVQFLTGIDLPGDDAGQFDTVLLHIPKGRLLARRWLLQAYTALSPGGSLFLAGANRSGIESIIKDARELFGPGRILGYKKGSRVVHFIKPIPTESLPAWSCLPGVAAQTWVEFSIIDRGQEYKIYSLPGVFSHDHLDEGTGMLLEAVEIASGSTVLDLGCGNGIIGMVAASRGATMVHLVDNNLLAVAASIETIRLNQLTNVEIFSADILEFKPPLLYDLILSNPPFHTGQAVDFQIANKMIRQSLQLLKPGGRLVIVANRFIRYDMLIKDIFGNVSVLAETGKFRLLNGLKSTSP